MDHEPWLEEISAALDDALTPEEQAALEAHLAQCSQCRALMEELGGIHSACTSLTAQAPQDLSRRVMEKIHTPAPVVELESRRPRRLPRRYLGVAAMFAVVCLCGGLYFFGVGQDTSPDLPSGQSRSLPQTDVADYDSVPSEQGEDPSANGGEAQAQPPEESADTGEKREAALQSEAADAPMSDDPASDPSVSQTPGPQVAFNSVTPSQFAISGDETFQSTASATVVLSALPEGLADTAEMVEEDSYLITAGECRQLLPTWEEAGILVSADELGEDDTMVLLQIQSGQDSQP